MVNMTVSEAEVYLGRPLTTMENLFTKHTYGLEDFHLYCLTIIFLIIFYTVANLPFVILDYLRLPFFEQYKLQPESHNSSLSTWQCFKAVMYTIVTTVGPLQVLSYPFFKLAGITGALPLPTPGDMALQLLVFFLVEDYGNYWLHRLLHHGWLYDKIHYKHHEFATPMAVSASYAHWAEVLILGVPSFVGPAIVQCHVITMWAWILIRTWEAIDTHSGYHFPWSPTRLIPFYGGAEYHDYHHLVGGQSKGNFASVFTYCDWLYGTDKGYRFKKALSEKQAKLE